MRSKSLLNISKSSSLHITNYTEFVAAWMTTFDFKTINGYAVIMQSHSEMKFMIRVIGIL